MRKNIHRIKITLQTPLAVGNDKSEQLSPLCDFIIKGREVIYIDPDKLGKRVLEKGLMDDFVRESGRLTNTRANFNLEQFVRNSLEADPEKLLLHRFHVRGRPDRLMYIRPLLKSAGRPYIPGSTVKGAIKTALLYHWLCNSETGRSRVKGIIELTANLFRSNSNLIGELENNNHQIDVLSGKIKRSASGSAERNRLRDVQNSLRRKARQDQKILSANISMLDKKLTETVEVLFGRLNNRQEKLHDFFCLRISDSSFIDPGDIVITEVKRLHLEKAELQTPQYMETLKETTSAESELSILPEVKQGDLKFLNQSQPELLWSVLNEFSKASVDTDWDILDSHANNFGKDDTSREVYDSLFDFYEQFSGDIGSGEKIAYLRLGFGKTYFDNSLGLAIYKQDPETFMKYVRLLQLGKPRQKEFPITRAVCTDPLIPMGWVTLKY